MPAGIPAGGNGNNHGNANADDNEKQIETPATPPGYDETLGEVEARIRRALPAKLRFVRGRDNAHPQIAQLLREDNERREAMTKKRYARDKPRFESRFEQRRLVFLSHLFVLLGRLDVQGLARGREGRELSAYVGDQTVKFRVETLVTLRPSNDRPAGKRNRWRSRSRSKSPAGSMDNARPLPSPTS